MLAKSVVLDGKSLKFDDIRRIAQGAAISIAPEAKEFVLEARQLVERKIQEGKPLYGINTGFGFFANVAIDRDKLRELQHNLIVSHAAGYGDPLPIPETRLAMVLRLNVLLKGLTGVRYELCEALLKLIQAEIYPIIPKYGSVGASGDLAPLAHLALPLIGLGKVHYQGQVMPAEAALKKANLHPFVLAEKEGLGLINGTQIMLAVGGLALSKGRNLLKLADKITALSYEGLEGIVSALDPTLHAVRGQIGQIVSAEAIRGELQGSYLFSEKRTQKKVQDPYSLRCAPQVHGPTHDAMDYVCGIISRELNAATDNPLVFTGREEIISGGNFHGQALAVAFDIAAMGLAEIGNISERRLELLLNPRFSGLPAFLSPNEGLCSGYMVAQYLSASLVNENKLLANPSCTDSIPGNVGVEDHVSMGMTSARKLAQIVENVKTSLSAEALAAAQAVDMRKAHPLGRGSGQTYQWIRKYVPPLDQDRITSEDIERCREALEHIQFNFNLF